MESYFELFDADENFSVADLRQVGVGVCVVCRPPTVLVTVLGSCVGVVIHDPAASVGGLAHVMIPYSRNREGNPAKFADTAIPEIICLMEKLGAERSRMNAKIIGGANMFGFSKNNVFGDIGARNVEVVKENLAKENIPLTGEEVGGVKGRTVDFIIRTGAVLVKEKNRIIRIL